jgi:hypothetical protein
MYHNLSLSGFDGSASVNLIQLAWLKVRRKDELI